MFEGIIYELDGLIIDSEPARRIAWNEYLQQHNLELSDYEVDNILYRPNYEAAELLYRRYDLDVDPLTMSEEYNELLLAKLDGNLELLPGVADSIVMFKDYNIRLAAVTIGIKDYLWYVLETLGIDNEFDVVVTGDMVGLAKPNPAQLLACAETFALHPGNVLSLDCRREGIEAAYNAGMQSICIPDRQTPRWRIGTADLVLNSMEQVNIYTLRSIWRDNPNEGPQLQPMLARDQDY